MNHKINEGEKKKSSISLVHLIIVAILFLFVGSYLGGSSLPALM
jgi:hypothetical protein